MTANFPRAHLKLIENKANGTPVVEMLEKEIPGMTRVNPEDGKVARASACAHELSAGNWFLPHPKIAPWVGNPENPTESGFIASTVLFPYGANDDDVDAWSQAGVRIQKEQIGGMFGVTEQQIRVDTFDLKLIDKWPKVFGMYVDWREVAVVWLTRQPETGQHYLYAEYDSPITDPATQAGDINKIGNCLGVMVPDIQGRDLKDGFAVIRKYSNLGLKLEGMPDRGDASIVDAAEALRSGKLKVAANLARFFDQYRMARRDDKGKLPSRGMGLIHAMLIAWRARSKMPVPAEHTRPASMEPSAGLPNSWMAS
jgi:predicted phage terminase large subunit-like protein